MVIYLIVSHPFDTIHFATTNKREAMRYARKSDAYRIRICKGDLIGSPLSYTHAFD